MDNDKLFSSNSLENLILYVNPSLGNMDNKKGIVKALKYRISSESAEIDSCRLVRAGYVKCYGNDIPDKADTILNAINPLKTFCIFRLRSISNKTNNKKVDPFIKINNRWNLRSDLLEVILNNLDAIFDGYKELDDLFNQFAEYMYSFANLMPAPKGLNGYSINNEQYFGKGTYSENNDSPYLYLDNLMVYSSDDRCGFGESRVIFTKNNTQKALTWLKNNMDKYYLNEMYSIKPPFLNRYESDEKHLEPLKKYLTACIQAIKNRGDWIRKNCPY